LVTPKARTDINWDAVKVIWLNGQHTREELGAMFGIYLCWNLTNFRFIVFCVLVYLEDRKKSVSLHRRAAWAR
jgi:hypothetical protein